MSQLQPACLLSRLHLTAFPRLFEFTYTALGGSRNLESLLLGLCIVSASMLHGMGVVRTQALNDDKDISTQICSNLLFV